MVKIGLVGTGMLGEAVGLHLLESGFSLTVYNRTKSKTKNLEQNGGIISDTPKHVAESSDLIITCVKDADAVGQILFGQNGIVAGKHEDLTVVEMSTINPNDAIQNSKRLGEEGINSLEIPVMGGPNVAIHGQLVLMASGNKDVFEANKEVFDVIANKTFFLGKSGSAHSIKIAMNLQISLLALALAEGITLTKKAGFDPEKFLEVLNSTYFKTGMSENKAHKMIRDEFEPTFTLKNLQKDLGIITEAAKDFGAVLPMAERANEIYRDAIDAGFGEIDYTGILAYIKKLSED
ncbi:NAD(P)-dependent oxidoreductase [Marine Group I thaumarchaeote]|uniref:NAD(P)-dependent oxidoreductase n=1 Tax=Marine Group I thaumarchaeote TaxID=2511932 RepID=A0A7K4NK26_9ARCH|nr:NAD(P)-dependent oxidoreductase [Marine Group I thaumarchaeote]